MGQPVSGKLFEFVPAIDDYLKEHLFGDIFARGVLTNQEREFATVSALASMEGVEPQFKVHLALAKNQHSGRGQALARRSQRQLVFPRGY